MTIVIPMMPPLPIRLDHNLYITAEWCRQHHFRLLRKLRIDVTEKKLSKNPKNRYDSITSVLEQHEKAMESRR